MAMWRVQEGMDALEQKQSDNGTLQIGGTQLAEATGTDTGGSVRPCHRNQKHCMAGSPHPRAHKVSIAAPPRSELWAWLALVLARVCLGWMTVCGRRGSTRQE